MRWLALVLLLSGCAPTCALKGTQTPLSVPFKAPEVAAIKPLLQPCPIEEVRRYTPQEVTRVANARRDALIQCNKDKAAALEKLPQ